MGPPANHDQETHHRLPLMLVASAKVINTTEVGIMVSKLNWAGAKSDTINARLYVEQRSNITEGEQLVLIPDAALCYS